MTSEASPHRVGAGSTRLTSASQASPGVIPAGLQATAWRGTLSVTGDAQSEIAWPDLGGSRKGSSCSISIDQRSWIR